MKISAIIEEYIGTVESCVELHGTTDAKIKLINNQYIVKTHITDGELVGSWYEYNQPFAPKVVYKSNELLIYSYIEASGSLNQKNLINLLQTYDPQPVGRCQDSYYEQLETEYANHCEQFNLESLILTKPNEERSYNLHGDMGYHNLLVTAEGIKLIDPEPLVGGRTLDLLQFYVSDPRLMRLLSVDKIKMYFEDSEFNYYFPVVLADRMMRSSYHHPQDLGFYTQAYYRYISAAK